MPICIEIIQLFPKIHHLQDSLPNHAKLTNYNDAIMAAVASQITSLTIVYSTVYSGADQWKHHSSASLAFVSGIHRWPVNSPHKKPVTRKMFPFDDVIMPNRVWCSYVFIMNKFAVWLTGPACANMSLQCIVRRHQHRSAVSILCGIINHL